MSLGELLTKYKERERYSVPQLVSLTGIPKQTIINWCNDTAKKPREPNGILKLAIVFNLTAAETNELLVAANQPTLEALWKKVELSPPDEGDELSGLLEHWPEIKPAPPFEAQRLDDAPQAAGTKITKRPDKRWPRLIKYYAVPFVLVALLGFMIWIYLSPAPDPPIPMIQIPAGEFQMGSTASEALAECIKIDPQGGCQLSWFVDEEPIHTVPLDAFYIDQFEVTNEQFAQFLNQEGNQIEGGIAWYAGGEDARIFQNRGVWQVDNKYTHHPVVEVSWFGAQAYCRWRGGKLPSEAEWEKAARGTDRLLYPWGNTFDDTRTNFCDSNCTESWANQAYDDGQAITAPVGSYPQGLSPYGVHDMGGNVWEWVRDWYAPDYYGDSQGENPSGPSSGEERVARGGAWDFLGSSTRTAVRAKVPPSDSNNRLGFRCVRSP